MNSGKKKSFISAFSQINQHAGVDQRVIDICAAYMRKQLRLGLNTDFYDPHPNIHQIETDDQLSRTQKDALKYFWHVHQDKGIDERVVNLLVAYAANLMHQNVAVLFSPFDFAERLELEYKTLVFISSHEYKVGNGYIRHKILKSSGEYREISAPRSKLKSVQRWILREILSNIEPHEAAHGFRRGHSIVTNASPHLGKAIIVKFDLKDFFPSITAPRVLGVFLEIGYAYQVALLLTRLITFNQTLPQGGPTSPAMANLVCFSLDKRLAGLAKTLGYSYTRYADDMTFSKQSPPSTPDRLIRLVKKIILEEGFECVPKKLTIQRQSSRQMVTGLVVNDKLNIPREKRRRIRAIIYNCSTKGVASQTDLHPAVFMKQLEGYVAFVTGVNKNYGKILSLKLHRLKRELF